MEKISKLRSNYQEVQSVRDIKKCAETSGDEQKTSGGRRNKQRGFLSQSGQDKRSFDDTFLYTNLPSEIITIIMHFLYKILNLIVNIAFFVRKRLKVQN